MLCSAVAGPRRSAPEPGGRFSASQPRTSARKACWAGVSRKSMGRGSAASAEEDARGVLVEELLEHALAQVERERLLEAALHLDRRVVRGEHHLALAARVHEVDQLRRE